LITTLLTACANREEARLQQTHLPSSIVPTFTSKIRIVPGLAEPLVTTKATTEAEDMALAEATESRDGATAPLVAFLASHPDSGWNAAIHTNLSKDPNRG
jgi:hypothetical protein